MDQTTADGPSAPDASGILYALAAFGTWGIVTPLHFKLLSRVEPREILAQRIVWAVLFALSLIAGLGRLRGLVAALSRRRPLVLLSLSALLVGVNWLVYIWAVSVGHMVEASLGYFVNPLVNVGLGVVFLGERLSRAQVLACALAAVGVAVMTVSGGAFPWIALTLAFSFGLYGLIRKKVLVDPLIGFCIEALVLLPLALTYLAVAAAGGATAFQTESWTTIALLVLTGVTTSAPLIWFAAAAQRLKLSTVGLLQYLSPTCLLLLGILAYGEPFTGAQAVSFAAIWTALALYSASAFGWGAGRRRRAPSDRAASS